MVARILLLLLAVRFASAGDWPQFLGPHRNGSSDEVIVTSWQEREPKVVWSKPVGSGFSGPIVFGGTTILFQREGSSEVLRAFDAKSGAPKWESKAPATYRDDFGFDEGPRSTPCVSDGRVYAMGADGLVRCVSLADGALLWSVDTRKQFKAGKGFFGMACSPVVHGQTILLNIGGENGAGIVALDRGNGALRWKATTHEASYASPVVGRIGSVDAAVFLTREGLVVLNPNSGRVLAQRAWRARMHASVNAATPLLIDETIFATSSYDTGAILARFDGRELKEIWSGDDQLSSHYATPVHYEGKLFGFHGRQEMGPSFRCVDLKTGKVLWDQPGFGGGSVTRVGGNLLILKETGELLLAPASGAGFQVNGRAQFLGDDVRAFPAVAHKKLFARDKRKLVCLELP